MTDDFSERLTMIEDKLGALDQAIARLSGVHVELSAGAVGLDGDIIEEPHAELVIAEGPPPGQTVAEWITGIRGTPGFVVDAGLARSTPCIRAELGDGSPPIVFSRGIIGALDQEQQEMYCSAGYEGYALSDERKARLEAIRGAAEACGSRASEGDTVADLAKFFSCLGSELRDRGVQP